MGISDPKMVTTEGQKNWTAACEREIHARFHWKQNWGWMADVIAEPIEKLKRLKHKNYTETPTEPDAVTTTVMEPPLLPLTTNHEYGWFAVKPEFKLERYGPFPLAMKEVSTATPAEVDREVKLRDMERAKKLEEITKEQRLKK